MQTLTELDFKRHPMITHLSDIRCIADPLKRIANITHFSYQKTSVNSQGQEEQVFFSTHPSFTEDIFVPEKFYEVAFFGDIDEYQDGFYLWDFFKGNVIHQAISQNIGMMNGITIVKKHLDYCEFYFFGTNEKNPLVNHFFVSNKDLFESFIHYFKKKAKTILQRAEKEKILMPKTSGDTTIIPAQTYLNTLNETLHNKYNLSFQKKSDNKLGNIGVDCFLDCQTTLHFSKREQQCAHYLLQGMTAKEIARLLGISHRTVEVYIERLKKRLNCNNKTQLVKKLIFKEIADDL